MLLPANFTSVVAGHFYDKTVSILGKTQTNTDGWVTEVSTTAVGTFPANVQFNNLEQGQSDLGLTERIDVIMTCLPDVAVKVDDLVRYDGITFKVMAARPRDSHLKIGAVKWRE